MTVADHRVGHPAPLIFHLSAALAAYHSGIVAAPAAAEPRFPWHPELPTFSGPAPATLDVAVEAARRLQEICAGISAWQAHPYRRSDVEHPVLWSEGSSRLIDHGTNPAAPPVLIVPSLINKAYVLDLLPENSFLKSLSCAGFRPLLLDWGIPGPEEIAFDIDTYVTRRLEPALAVAKDLKGAPCALLGYCMGGTLAVGSLRRDPGQASCLVAIGAPWDFTRAQGLAAEVKLTLSQLGITRLRAHIRAISDAFGFVPKEVFELLFAIIDPLQVSRKFRRFAAMDRNGSAARQFSALEDWLADGVPMSGPAAENLLIDWHLENAPARGSWPDGALRPTLDLPALVIAGRRDSIAPLQVADSIRSILPGARHLRPDLGHVGMITGAKAATLVLDPVVAFLKANA